jgi:TRAP-type C4-dicarboxylate transport system substrate-binding protein
VRVSTSPAISVFPQIGVFSMPYLFRSQDHMWNVLNGPVGQHFLAAMEPIGLVGLGYFDPGSRNFYTTKPLKSAADLKGLKIRVQPNPIMVNLVNSSATTPINWADITARSDRRRGRRREQRPELGVAEPL